MARVLAARVAETDDEKIERRGAFASAPREPHLALGGAGLALLARSRIGGWIGGAFGRTLGLLLGRNRALGELLALLGDLGRLLDARRQADAREHGLFRVVEVGHALERREVDETQRIADGHAADIEIDVLRHFHRERLHADLTLNLRKDAAFLRAGRLADQLNRDGRLDGLVEADFLEIDVRDVAANRILLVVLEDRRVRRLLPLEHHVQDGVQPALPRQNTTEVALRNADRVWLLAAAVQDA